MYRAVTGSGAPFESVGAPTSQIFGKPMLDYTPSILFKTAPPPAAPDSTSQLDRLQLESKVKSAASAAPDLTAPKPVSHPPTYTRTSLSPAPEATGTHLNTKA